MAFIKKHIFAVFYTAALIAFTVYLLLDTFVITRVYDLVQQTPADTSQQMPPAKDESLQSETPDDTQTGDTADPEPVISTDTLYSDGNITVKLTEYRQWDTDIYVAEVTLASPEYLKTALAQNAYGKNVTEKTSQTAQEAGAILAVNGDFYGSRETGYVMRNGVVYRDVPADDGEALAILEDGSFLIVNEANTQMNELLEAGAVQVLSFGPALVEDGDIAVTESDEVGRAMASNPRTAIGVTSDMTYLFVVSDGRTDESEGLSLSQLASFMQSLGAQTAYNLDGGGSSTMYFNGRVVNQPTTSGRRITEREVSDIVFIGY